MAASKTKTTGAANTATGTHPAKGVPRPQAVVDAIDFTAVAGADDLARQAPVRNSKWMQILDALYKGTEEGKVPRQADQSLSFVKLGEFNNPGGARTQVKAFEDKELDQTYEFKTVVNGKQSFLWARVREVTEATA
jgi:hypothetical protein